MNDLMNCVIELDLPPLPIKKEAEELRDSGANLAWNACNLNWRVKAWAALQTLRHSGKQFNADDLVRMVGRPDRPGAMGALFLQAVKDHQIQCVGYTKMQNRRAHARRTPLYVGC